MAILMALTFGVVALGAPGSAQDYQTELAGHLAEASVFLDEAGQAIDECTRELVSCFSDPDDIVTRIDSASQGLIGVVGNMSAMEVPPQNAANHALLIGGFGMVTDGFALYNDGLLQREPGVLGVAGDLITDGNNQIRSAINGIFAQPPPGLDLVQLLTYVVIGATAGLGVLLYALLRAFRHEGRALTEKNIATCPECGEVMDQWWTYRRGQVRKWLESHLLSHEREASE